MIRAVDLNAGTVTLNTRQDVPLTLQTNRRTEIVRNDQPATLRDLQPGDDARAVYDSSTLLAASIVARGGDAFGNASITVAGSNQKFSVSAYRLKVRSNYKLVVDGNVVASDASASLGSLTLVFSTDPGRLSLAGPLNPVTNIRHVELRDALDRMVLEGDFAADVTTPAGGFVERQTRLSATGPSPAAGHSTVRIETVGDGTRREHLSIEAEGLISNAVYRFIADGVSIGTTAARSGFSRVHLTSDGSSGQLLPPSLRPVINIKRVEVLDANGVLVLQGDFPAGK